MVDTYHSLTQPPTVRLSKIGKSEGYIPIHQTSDPRIELLDLKAPDFFNIESESGEVLSGAIYQHDVEKFGE